MAQDDPEPGSSWIGGGKFYGEKIPRVAPKSKTSGKNIFPMRETRNQAQNTPQLRQQAIKRLQENTDPEIRKLKSDVRRKAIAKWQNRQDA
jgi:hypothetical protein